MKSHIVTVTVGPRKRLLAFPFAEGDLIRNVATGENMRVDRVDDRGVLVKRSYGSVRAQSLTKGDELRLVAQFLHGFSAMPSVVE